MRAIDIWSKLSLATGEVSEMGKINFTDFETVERLQEYIESEFTLDTAAKQLIRSIIEYAFEMQEDDEQKFEFLCHLLGSIGITSEDIVFGSRNRAR